MHMADALVTPAVAGTMYACSAAVAFPKYDLIGLLGMAVYLIAGFLLAELSFGKCLRRLRVVLPLVYMVGLNMDYSGWGISGKQTVSAADSRKAGVCVSEFRQPVIYVNCI